MTFHKYILDLLIIIGCVDWWEVEEVQKSPTHGYIALARTQTPTSHTPTYTRERKTIAKI